LAVENVGFYHIVFLDVFTWRAEYNKAKQAVF